MRRAALFGVVAVLSLTAGDWLNLGGDAQHSGWQRRGKTIGVENAGQIKLLWKQKLGMGPLTAPVMLGPIVTHRGIKELVFVGAASDEIYAVDADLGRVFWKRHIEYPPYSACWSGLTATPAMEPALENFRVNEDDDEGHTPMRPFYFVASDGVLHTVRPADGVDMAPTKNLVPDRGKLSALTFANGFVYATTTGTGCGTAPEGVWAIAKTENATPEFLAAKGSSGVSVGLDGTVYAAASNGIAALASGTLKQQFFFSAPTNGNPPIPFIWQKRTVLLVAAGRRGDLALLDSGKLITRHAGDQVYGLATWVDPGGVRWVYASVHNTIAAFRVVESAGEIKLVPDWVSRELGALFAPVIANGVVFAAAQSTARGVLYALDAHSGRQLYVSADAIPVPGQITPLAVANGHVAFGTSDGTLYCFGLPIEI